MKSIQSTLIYTWAFLAMTLLISCESQENPIVEIPPLEDGFIEINGGGATFPNMVFINLRKGEQITVRRDSWDLAFSSGNDFRVLINGTTGAMAYETDQTDMNAVDESMASPLATSGVLELSFTNMESILHVDDANNPLNQPRIKSISSNDSDNKVYILNRGSSGAESRPWKKIRILQRNGKYLVQHADVNAGSFNTLEVEKDTNLNFVYVNFNSGKVNVEPAKADWDFVWSAGTSTTPFPQAVNGTLAYFFQDLVKHNIYGGVSATQVMESDISYENFNETHLFGFNLTKDNRLTIGPSWRSGGGPNSAPAIREDRFYLILDSSGNIYKVRFLSLTKDGERGRPSFEYALVKSGN